MLDNERRTWHGLCLLIPHDYRRLAPPSGGTMRSILKAIIVAPAVVLSAACSKDKAADPSLNNDLSLAAQANPNARLDSISAAERTNGAAAPAPGLRSSTAPAAAPAPEGAALVEHLVDRLSRSEHELSQAQDAAAGAERERALLRSAAHVVASAERVDAADVIRPFLPTLGLWCLVDQLTNGHAERRLVASDAALAQGARSVEGGLTPDGAASLGPVRALRRRRSERLDQVLPTRPASFREDDPAAAAWAALEQLVAGPVLVVPIFARGRIVGGLSFCRASDPRRFIQRD